jgi:hypothetical protein
MQRVSDRDAYIVLSMVGALCLAAFVLIRVPRALKAEASLITSDGPGYYAYLRSLVFDGDLDFRNEYRHFDFPVGKITPTGLVPNQWSIGPAILWAPFYLAVHALSQVARALGLQVTLDGYGYVYESAVGIGTIVYVTAGCVLAYRVCRRYFYSCSSLLAVLGISLASTLVHYTVAAPAMSHGLSFFAVSLFLFLWHPPRSRTYKEWGLLGLSAGLMGVVRQENLLFLSLPAVEAIYAAAAPRGVRSRIRALAPYLRGAVIASVPALFVIAPQLLAWKTLYGSPVVFTQPARFFDWLHPDLLGYLLSPSPGWFTWTPIVPLATIGFVPIWQRDRRLATALLTSLLLVWYVASSVRIDYRAWEWTYGARIATSTSSVLALGLAALTESFAQRFRRGPLVMMGVLTALVGWNLLGELQYSLGFISYGVPLTWSDLVAGKLEMILQLAHRALRAL